MDTLQVIWPVAIVILGITVAQGLRLVKQATGHLKESARANAFSATITHVLDTVDTLLQNASLTIISDLKEKTADGQLTKEEIEQIIQHVKQNTLAVLGDDAKIILESFVGDYEKWLTDKITPLVNRQVAAQQLPVVVDGVKKVNKV